MVFVGLLVTILGFFISVASLGITSGLGTRLIIVLAGIAVSLYGIIGVVNQAYLKTAIWRRSK